MRPFRWARSGAAVYGSFFTREKSAAYVPDANGPVCGFLETVKINTGDVRMSMDTARMTLLFARPGFQCVGSWFGHSDSRSDYQTEPR